MNLKIPLVVASAATFLFCDEISVFDGYNNQVNSQSSVSSPAPKPAHSGGSISTDDLAKMAPKKAPAGDIIKDNKPSSADASAKSAEKSKSTGKSKSNSTNSKSAANGANSKKSTQKSAKSSKNSAQKGSNAKKTATNSQKSAPAKSQTTNDKNSKMQIASEIPAENDAKAPLSDEISNKNGEILGGKPEISSDKPEISKEKAEISDNKPDGAGEKAEISKPEPAEQKAEISSDKPEAANSQNPKATNPQKSGQEPPKSKDVDFSALSNDEAAAQAKKFYDAKDYDGAKKGYEHLLAKGADTARAEFMLGEIALAKGAYSDAVAHYQKSYKADSAADYAPALLANTAKSLEKLGDTENAGKFRDALKSKFPDSPEAKSAK